MVMSMIDLFPIEKGDFCFLIFSVANYRSKVTNSWIRDGIIPEVQIAPYDRTNTDSAKCTSIGFHMTTENTSAARKTGSWYVVNQDT